MAGGMSKRDGWGSMKERVGRAYAPADATNRAECPVKPCWVLNHQGRLPGLLLGWRQVEGIWDGRVVYATLEDGAWVVVEEWLPAGLLEKG